MSIMDKIKSMFSGGSSAGSDDHAGHDHAGHDHDHAGHDHSHEAAAPAMPQADPLGTPPADDSEARP